MGLYLASLLARDVPQIGEENRAIVNLREATENDRPNWVAWIVNETSRIVTKTINSYACEKNKGYFFELFQSRCPPGSIVTPFPTWNVNFHIITNRDAAIEFFRHHRQGDIFSIEGTGNQSSFISLMKLVFPKLEIKKNDVIQTCESVYTTEYHSLLSCSMHESFMSESESRIDAVVASTLQEWEELAKQGPINISLKTQEFMTEIMGTLFLGYRGSYARLSKAMEHIFSQNGRVPLNDKTKTSSALEEAVSAVADTVDRVLLSSFKGNASEFLKAMENRMYSDEQKHAMLLMLFFEGQGTTANVLNYIMLKCAQMPELQESIAAGRISVKELMVEGLRMMASRGFIGRVAKKDLVMTLKNEEHNAEEFRYYISKGDRVVAAPSIMGRDATLVPGGDPHVFDPYRWGNQEISDDFRSLNWFPFGGGIHGCPGSKIAQKAMHVFLDNLFKKFVLLSDFEEEPRLKYSDECQMGIEIQFTSRAS